MSDQVLGAQYELLMGATRNNQQPMHGIASGLDQVVDSLTQDLQRISSGGSRGASPGAHHTLQFTFVTLSDSEHDEVLAAAAGQRRYFTAREIGTGAGRRQATGECVLQTELVGIRTGSILIWSVTADIDGDPDRTAQP